MTQPGLFDDTTVFRDRRVSAVTFQGKLGRPIHRWYRLTPSFSPQLADDIADHFDLGPRDLVLDPFSGVGTVPLCMKYMAGPVRYLRRFVEHPEGRPELDFDVITEVWFNDKATLDIVVDFNTRDAMPADVIADEEKFLDRSKSRFCAVEECEIQL